MRSYQEAAMLRTKNALTFTYSNATSMVFSCVFEALVTSIRLVFPVPGISIHESKNNNQNNNNNHRNKNVKIYELITFQFSKYVMSCFENLHLC